MALSLSLPEAFVVLEGPRADPHEVVFLAMLDLVARGSATLVRTPGAEAAAYAFRPTAATTVVGPSAALTKLLGTCTLDSTATGERYVPTREAASAFARTWSSAGAYVRAEVWPALVARGLVRTRPNLLDALFAVDAWHLTPEGREAREALQRNLVDPVAWNAAPATSLLTVMALAVPSEAVLDALDELEDLITPSDPDYVGGQ